MWHRSKPRTSRVQWAKSSDLLNFSETTLNEIGRAIEAYRSGDQVGLTVACNQANLLRDMLCELSSRSD